MEGSHRNPLRLIAPIALVVFGLALILVISSAGGSGDKGGGGVSAAEKSKDLGAAKTTSTTRSHSSKSGGRSSSTRVYVVHTGDTLGGIAGKTGISVERLQELNPGLDQFSLVAGQKIKLR